MKVKNTKVLMPAISVAVLALGGGYYGLQLVNNQNNLPKALAYTSTINPVDPSTAPDSYEIKFTDNNFKRALNSNLIKIDNSRNIDSPITVGDAKKLTEFNPDGPYRNFENFEGIQYFTNLETIHVHGIRELKDISAASTLTKIKKAYLSSSSISDMSATKNWKQVGLIWIHDNHVTDFSFLKDLPHAGVWGIRSNVKIKAQKGQRILKNPFINFDGTIMPIKENENFINVDVNGNPKQDGGYVKIIKPILKGNYGFDIPENKDTLPSGNKFYQNYSVSYASVEGIDVNSEEKPNIHFNFNGSSILLKEDTPLVWEKPRQDNSTFNENTITSLKRDYSPQAGGTFFTATSQTSNITSITSDAEEVFNNKENQINGDYLITVTATNDFGNTITAKFRLLAPFVNREPVKKALENFESQPDYIKKAIPTELVNEASLKINKTQNILAENKSKPDELPVIDIEKIEELISKVKDEAKSKELTKKLQDIKDKIKAKEAKIELDKLEAARKKRDAEIAKQRLNSPETGFLREQNQENKATVPVLIGLVSLIISPVVVLFAKRRNRKMRKF